MDLVLEAISILRFFQSKKIQSKKGYLLFCQIFGDDEDEVMAEASEWEGKIALLRKAIKQSERKLDERFRQETSAIHKLVDEKNKLLEDKIATKMTEILTQKLHEQMKELNKLLNIS